MTVRHSFGGGEYEVKKVDKDMFIRYHTSLGPTEWKYFESGDTPFEDACCEILRLKKALKNVGSNIL